MDNYSEESREIMTSLILSMNEAVAKISLAENVPPETVARQITLFNEAEHYVMERDLSPFNVFLKHFKLEYAENKEMFQSDFPDRKL